MSVLEILKLPPAFGSLLLVLGLILTLAPWFHGLDFGVLKIPDFAGPTRRVLKIHGTAGADMRSIAARAGADPAKRTATAA